MVTRVTLPAWRIAQLQAGGVNDAAPVLTEQAPKRVNADRHSPGYMAAYMRAWRQRKKAAKAE